MINDRTSERIAELVSVIRGGGFKEEIEETYRFVRQAALAEIVLEELALGRVVRMLQEIYRGDRRHFELAMLLLTHPLMTWRDVGNALGVSPSTAWRWSRKLAARHNEFRLLLRLRRAEIRQDNPQRTQNDDFY